MAGLSQLFPMRTAFVLFSCVAGFLLATAAPAQPSSEIVVMVDNKATPIDIAVTGGDLQLVNLARLAFNAHGRYRLVGAGSSPKYTLNFTLVAPNQVQVDITGNLLHSSLIAPGADKSDALLRAADAAVKATSHLKGFFASKLAFVGKRGGVTEIYTSNLFVTDKVLGVTSDRKQLMFPRWSPNGADIIYTSLKTGAPDVVLIDLAPPYHRTNIASFKGTNGDARFSPDGRHIAMVLSGEGSTEIYVSDARGGGIARKTHSPEAKSSPCFSPDSTEIIFAMETGPHLYRMPVAGGTPQLLSTGLSYNYYAEPDWSRGDPGKIAFTVGVGGNHYQVFAGKLNGQEITDAKRVSEKVGSQDAQEPVWLADGRHLVCTAKLTGDRSSLWLVDTETLKATQLTRPDGPNGFGACSEASVLDP